MRECLSIHLGQAGVQTGIQYTWFNAIYANISITIIVIITIVIIITIVLTTVIVVVIIINIYVM